MNVGVAGFGTSRFSRRATRKDGEGEPGLTCLVVMIADFEVPEAVATNNLSLLQQAIETYPPLINLTGLYIEGFRGGK